MNAEGIERRSYLDRRRSGFASVWHGARKPRRRFARRTTDRLYPSIDWHSPRVLALALAILGLCVLDGVLTVVLMSHGAVEVNPVMALFLPEQLGWFAATKLALTGIGMCVLVACSRMRLFRAVPGEWLLYPLLLCYVLLIGYELRMLELAHHAQ